MIKHICTNPTCHHVFYTYSRKDLFCSRSCRDSELLQDCTELKRIEDKYILGEDKLPTSNLKAKWILTKTPEERLITRSQKPALCRNCQKTFYTYFAQTLYCSSWCKEHHSTNQDIFETTKIAHSNVLNQTPPEATVSLDFKDTPSLSQPDETTTNNKEHSS